jgi:hypothetical protein
MSSDTDEMTSLVDACIANYEDEEVAFLIADGILKHRFKLKTKQSEDFINARFKARDDS